MEDYDKTKENDPFFCALSEKEKVTVCKIWEKDRKKEQAKKFN